MNEKKTTGDGRWNMSAGVMKFVKLEKLNKKIKISILTFTITPLIVPNAKSFVKKHCSSMFAARKTAQLIIGRSIIIE